MNIQQNLTLMEKLAIFSDAAKYDVSCSSSGVDRGGNSKGMGNSLAAGICHSFAADGRCISLLKILFTNECIFNCSYCQNNCNSDVPRASFTPDEVCELTNELMVYRKAPRFVPGGQSTQMIIGATPENDYQIISVAESLYNKFELKRVYYSAFVNVTQDSNLPALPGGSPLLREHRLYQADWLLRFYDFKANELLSEERPDINIFLDPKCDWAIRHLECFPVEIHTADYHTLLRVPGIGMKSAKRIVQARRNGHLDFNDLKKIGVVLKRALYFITCSGKMMYPTKLEENYICQNLIADKTQIPREIRESGYQQISFFDTGLEETICTSSSVKTALMGY